MTIKKRLLIPAPENGGAIFTTRTTYVAKDGTDLLQEYAELPASDTFGNFYSHRSSDNGASWSPPILTAEPKPHAMGTLRRGEFAFLLDEHRNRLFRFYNLSVYPALTEYTVSVGQYTAIHFETSYDGGQTFSEPEQLIVHGGTPARWAPDVEYGQNSIVISFCQPLIDQSGRIILPTFWRPVLREGAQKPFPLDALCLFGETDPRGKIRWSAGARATVDPTLSSRGLGEPTLAELPGGRLLMICRGSNAKIPEAPSRKWMTYSDDGGLSWAAPKAWHYDTGELFFSPATGSRLIRSSKNGKLYWIGNIIPENANGNRPRYPLCMSEVDEEKLALRKATVAAIDSRGPSDTVGVQLSNFHAYEDRVTQEIVLIMSRIFEHCETSLSSPAYEYRITVS